MMMTLAFSMFMQFKYTYNIFGEMNDAKITKMMKYAQCKCDI